MTELSSFIHNTSICEHSGSFCVDDLSVFEASLRGGYPVTPLYLRRGARLGGEPGPRSRGWAQWSGSAAGGLVPAAPQRPLTGLQGPTLCPLPRMLRKPPGEVAKCWRGVKGTEALPWLPQESSERWQGTGPVHACRGVKQPPPPPSPPRTVSATCHAGAGPRWRAALRSATGRHGHMRLLRSRNGLGLTADRTFDLLWFRSFWFR